MTLMPENSNQLAFKDQIVKSIMKFMLIMNMME